MSQSPKRIYLRKSNRLGSWTKGWQDLWRSDWGDVEYIRADLVVERAEFEPTPEGVNALPEPLRQYIHDLETRCDPAGDVQRIAFLRQENEGLRNVMALAMEWERAFRLDDLPDLVTPGHAVQWVRGMLKERAALLREKGEAWGLLYCCDGSDCACQGKPVDPPSWWFDNQEATAAAKEILLVLQANGIAQMLNDETKKWLAARTVGDTPSTACKRDDCWIASRCLHSPCTATEGES